MNIKNFILSVLSLFFIVVSCKKNDDDGIELIPLRDEAEVYEENIIEIEEYLDSHSFNYEDFDFDTPNSPANDNFVLKLEVVPEDNPNSRTLLSEMTGGDPGSLLDVLQSKIVEQNGIDYKLYYLKIREGEGDNLHSLDRAIVNYNGYLTNDDVFDSAVTPITFNLTSVGSIGGVVTGFREGLIEFKTSIGVSTAPDGVDTYESHGIGAVFIPSGIAYFASGPPSIGPYKPIIFTLNLIDRLDTDFDNDGIPSHLEDRDEDGDGFNDNTDADSFPDFIDSDDDGDGVLTINEDLNGNGDPTDDDSNMDGTPNYLDATATESN